MTHKPMLPCPFCGDTPVLTKHYKFDSYSFMHRCPVLGPVSWDFREEADSHVEQWNKRAALADPVPPAGGEPEVVNTDCRSDEGVTVGLIDTIINCARLMKGRSVTPAVEQALKDLNTDGDVRDLISNQSAPTLIETLHANGDRIAMEATIAQQAQRIADLESGKGQGEPERGVLRELVRRHKEGCLLEHSDLVERARLALCKRCGNTGSYRVGTAVHICRCTPQSQPQGEPVAFLPSEVELIAAGFGYPLSKEDAVQAHAASLQPRTDHPRNEDCEHCYGAGHDYNGDPCVGCCKPAEQPAPVAVDDCDKALMDRHEAWKAGEANGVASMVMPERAFEDYLDSVGTYFGKGWNACLDEVARLNPGIKS